LKSGIIEVSFNGIEVCFDGFDELMKKRKEGRRLKWKDQLFVLFTSGSGRVEVVTVSAA